MGGLLVCCYTNTDLWYGAELRPIAPGRSERLIREDMDAFFGGVLLVPNEQFRQVNGYANCYWGWGFEDTDLKYRFVDAGIKLQRPKGTFRPLRHNNEGFDLNGKRNAIANVN
jgi:hypothetical protein